MARKEIIWAELAKLQFATVLEFYALRNGNANYSLKLVQQVEDLLDTLSQMELLGRLTANKVTRVLVLKDYLITYEINTSRIEILSFWDNRQNDSKKKIK